MGLTERIHRNVDLTLVEGQIPINYIYTYGLGNEEFFRKLKDQGKFTASRCKSCGFTYLPVRVFCERCMTDTEGSIEVPGTGTVYAFTLVHLDREGSPLKEPALVALIDMDGTDCRLAHYLTGVSADEVKIGMRVKPVLKAKKDRVGHIEDIVGFQPI